MEKTYIPQGYAPCLNLYDTQKAIAFSSAFLRTPWAARSICAVCPPPCSWRPAPA